MPLDKKTLAVTDDTRIRGSIPTIKYLVSKGAKVLLTSHLGRPSGGYEAKFSLASIIPRLSELLGQSVALVPDCIGMAVAKTVAAMKEGDVVLLENVRFYPEEEANDASKSLTHFPIIEESPLSSMSPLLMWALGQRGSYPSLLWNYNST